VHRIEERLDAEAVADGDQRLVTAIGDDARELTAQMLDRTHTLALIKVEEYLAVGIGGELEAVVAQIVADRPVTIEFAVDDDSDVARAVRDGLGAVTQPDNGEPGVAEEPEAVVGYPSIRGIGSPVDEGRQGLVDLPRIDRFLE
jgi:hypothetical protein